VESCLLQAWLAAMKPRIENEKCLRTPVFTKGSEVGWGGNGASTNLPKQHVTNNDGDGRGEG